VSNEPDRKELLKELARRFGGCGCKDACQVEQFGEDGNNRKPCGRFSVCEVEADKLRVMVPKRKTP